MEPSSLRNLIALMFCLLLYTQTQATNPTFNSDEIRKRVEKMELIVAPRYTTVVEGYVKKYLAYKGGAAKRIMGRSAIYFPIFDQYLKEHGMPADLKYLAIVESALVPKAVSPVGAGGLWQFMAQTGRLFDLEINGEVDERACAHRSTLAAIKYLEGLYERYNSWELALAAYNCGAGNINRAIKRARTDNYWALSNVLPRETRNFVPAFIGAAYIANYFHLHEIEPESPSLDLQITEAFMVFDKIELDTIAAITGLPLFVIEQLNQSFKKNHVPESERGYYVVLPRRTIPSLKEYLGLLRPDGGDPVEMPELPPVPDSSEYIPEAYYFRSVYTVAEGDELDKLAASFNCSAYNLIFWNNLTSSHLSKKQELIVWFPKEMHHFLPQPEKIEVEPEVQHLKKLAPPKKIPVLKTEVVPVTPLPAPLPTIVQEEKTVQPFRLSQLPQIKAPLILRKSAK